MSATFSNPRWDALPCERMRGCSFADDFLTLKRSEQNDGVDSGTGNTADHGLTLTGAGWFVYDVVSQPSGFSVHARFKSTGTPASVIADGDMEDSGTTAWTGGGAETLTKETTSPQEGVRLLRITANADAGTTYPVARQTILILGKTYRVQGYARSDGTEIPKVNLGGTGWLGTNNTSWQRFDFVGTSSLTTCSLYFTAVAPSGTEYVEFDDVTVTPIETIIYNESDIIAGIAGDGFAIWFDTDGIKANHTTGATVPTQCAVAISDMRLGTIFDVTYVVDMVGGTHKLYVNDYAVDSQATTVNTEIGTTNPIEVGWGLAGTLYKARIFDALLTEAEHDVYHAGTLETFMVKPWAVYRCDAWNDDVVGHYLWDRTTEMRDLEKADRVTSSKFPVLASTPTPHYVFDGVDDYLTSQLTLPSAYTITAAKSAAGYASGTAYPVIQQHNDTTFLATLLSSGGYSGLLHSLIVHSKQLTQLEKYADEYAHKYWLWRGRAYGAVQRLITEGVCVFSIYPDYSAYPYTDYVNSVVGTVSGTIGGGGSSGVWFQERMVSQLLIDGDMEAVGVGAYTGGGDETLSKETVNPQEGVRLLRITADADAGTIYPVARQTILILGKTYRVQGWARSDGTEIPKVDMGGTGWLGTNNTSWQRFDFVGTSSSTTCSLYFTAVAPSGTEYVEFDDVTVYKILNDGYLTYPDSADLECRDFTIHIEGDFDTAKMPGTIVDKGTNYKLRTEGDLIDFNGSTIAHVFNNDESITVSGRYGEKPRFSVSGIYIGEGSTTVTPDSADSTELTIGSNNEHDEATQYRIKQVHIFNRALTDV